jgi:PKD repeat protein
MPQLSVGPQALFTSSQVAHPVPFTASFDGTLSYNPSGGEISSYVWTFGDGGSATGPVVDHQYQQDGNYQVTLTVFDGAGRSSSTSMEVQALNPAPTAEFTYSPTSKAEDEIFVSASEWIIFDAGGSSDDEEVVSYHWYFGRTASGEAKETDGETVKCRFLYPGTYSVVLTVTDNDGGTSQCVRQVRVEGGSPCNADVCQEYPWLSIED